MINTSSQSSILLITQQHNPKIQIMHEQKQSLVSITVSDPEVRKEYGGARQYYLYALKGEDSRGPINIHRRYSDFDSIRGLLVKRWPGCYIPSLPSKVKLAHSDEEFLETRSKYLQKFLLEVARKPFLWESDEMQIFLRNDMMDLDKVLAPLWKVEPAELLYRFNTHFGAIPAAGAMEVRIENFSEYLKTLYVKVQELRNRSQEINSAQSKYQKKYSKFLLNVLASYEEKFLQYYNRDNPDFHPIFSAPENSQKKTDLEQSLKEEPLRVLFQQLKRQKREIFAMQEAIEQYDSFIAEKAKIQAKIKEHQIKITELKGGRKSFLSKIRSLSTDDEIKGHEKSIQKYKSELQTIVELCEVMTRVLLVTEIESFKQERTSSYYRMVKQIAQEELKIIEKEREFWLAVSNNSNFNFEIQEKDYVQKKEIPSKPSPKKQEQVKKQAQQEQKAQQKVEVKSEPIKQDPVQTIVTKVESIKAKSKEKEKEGEGEVTQKTKSVADSPERQNSTDSPQQPIIINDEFQQAREHSPQIKCSNINIEVSQSPPEEDKIEPQPDRKQ